MTLQVQGGITHIYTVDTSAAGVKPWSVYFAIYGQTESQWSN